LDETLVGPEIKEDSMYPLGERKTNGSSARSAAAGKRASRNLIARLESLEGRALLSHIGHARSAAAQVAHPPIPDPQPGPIISEFAPGIAVKGPRFYPFFGGARTTSVNVAGAGAHLHPDGNLFLTGIVVDPINTAPTDPSQDAFYTFGINRGSGTVPGPFPGRPDITFDALVTVSITQAGITTQVQDLTTPNAPPTTLPAGSVQIMSGTLKVTVPFSLLPSPTGASVNQYGVNFWASNTPSVTNYRSIGSFVPEFRDFKILPPNG
jgi:hypothetical protein